MPSDPSTFRCNFCGSRKGTQRFWSGPRVFICATCLGTARKLVLGETASAPFRVLMTRRGGTCSFCGCHVGDVPRADRPNEIVHAIVCASDCCICNACIEICLESPEQSRAREAAAARAEKLRLFPSRSFEWADFRAFAEHRSATFPGGGFYDVWALGGRPLVGMVGEVGSEGSSAVWMALASLRLVHQRPDLPPGELIVQLCGSRERTSRGPRTEAVCVQLDAAGRRVLAAYTGNVPPFLRRGSGEVSRVEEGQPCDQLQPEDIVLLMSDSTIELLGGRFMDLLSNPLADLAELRQRIVSQIDRKTNAAGGQPQDITILGLQLVGTRVGA